MLLHLKAALAKAKEEGDEEEVDKQSRRLVKVGKEHVEDCKELLKLMGIPFVSAPCEVCYLVHLPFSWILFPLTLLSSYL